MADSDLDVLHSFPLVDKESLIAVHEPGQILQPLQVDWDGAVVEEESTKQHERYDEGWANSKGYVKRRSQAGYEVT